MDVVVECVHVDGRVEDEVVSVGEVFNILAVFVPDEDVEVQGG